MLNKYRGRLKALFSVASLIVLFYQIDTRSLQLNIHKVDLYAIAQLVALMCTLFFIQAVRWWLIGTRLGLKWSLFTSIELTFIGAFFNQILPSSSGGDVVRAWKLTRMGVSIRHAGSSVVLDRASGFLALGLMFCLGFSVSHKVLDSYVGSDGMMMVLYFALLALIALTGLLAWVYERSPSFRHMRLTSAILMLGNDAKLIIRSPLVFFLTTAISLIVQFAGGFIAWRLAWSFGAKLDFFQFSLLWPVVMLLSMIPISIAGWGVREGAMVIIFNILGSPSSIALATSITFGIIIILASIPGGATWVSPSFSRKFRHKPLPSDRNFPEGER
jgi:uncharacterized protein (TIRG00374 family)